MVSNLILKVFTLSVVLNLFVSSTALTNQLQLKVTRLKNGDIFETNGICVNCARYNAYSSGPNCASQTCCYKCTCFNSGTFVVNEKVDLYGGICLINPNFDAQTFQPPCDMFLGFSNNPKAKFAAADLGPNRDLGAVIARGNSQIPQFCLAYGANIYNGFDWVSPKSSTPSDDDFVIAYQHDSINAKVVHPRLFFNGEVSAYIGRIVRVHVSCSGQATRCILFKALGPNTYDLSSLVPTTIATTTLKTTTTQAPTTTRLPTTTKSPTTTKQPTTTQPPVVTVETLSTKPTPNRRTLITIPAVTVAAKSSTDEDGMSLGVLILTIVVIVLSLAFLVIVALFIRSRTRERKRTFDSASEASVEYNNSNGNVGFHGGKSKRNKISNATNTFGSSDCIVQEENYEAINDPQNFYTSLNTSNAYNGGMKQQLPGQRASETYATPDEMQRMHEMSNGAPPLPTVATHPAVKKPLAHQPSVYQSITPEEVANTNYSGLDDKQKRVHAPSDCTYDSYEHPSDSIATQSNPSDHGDDNYVSPCDKIPEPVGPTNGLPPTDSSEYDSYIMPYDSVKAKSNVKRVKDDEGDEHDYKEVVSEAEDEYETLKDHA